jgi:hypothetical protein
MPPEAITIGAPTISLTRAAWSARIRLTRSHAAQSPPTRRERAAAEHDDRLRVPRLIALVMRGIPC